MADRIYKAKKEDAYIVACMAAVMWRGNTLEEHLKEFEEIIADEESAVYIYSVENQAVGFAQCQLRHDYVEGTDSSPVGYLEGIFVKEGHRKLGYAKEMLEMCEEWARGKGCSEFASDCEMTNNASLEFHIKTGFTEANRIICFTKKL